ncbi:MAG: class I SAM-dependent methyltransferase [Paracoccaceae bacterium]|nr:class I SAM-dependent methyltransferase [Paracoccaceae bacterium]
MQTAAFWDNIAERYAARPVGDPDAYEAGLQTIRGYLTPGMQVLELGCGTGTTALKLADTGAEITGTDISGEMVRIAEEKRAEAGIDTVQFRQGDAVSAFADGARYEAVLAFNLLHLLDDLDAAVARIHAALAPGGVLISKTPCLGGQYWLWPILKGMQLLGKAPKPINSLRTADLDAAVRRAGFEIVEASSPKRRIPHYLMIARKA